MGLLISVYSLAAVMEVLESDSLNFVFFGLMLMSQSTAMVMSRQSIHLTILFPRQA